MMSGLNVVDYPLNPNTMPSSITLPTWITLSRLLGIPFILYGLAVHTPQGRWLALSAFLIAAGTDWLDGYLARRLDQVSELGKVLDPLVDKLLVIAALLSLVEVGQIPAWGSFLIVGREVAIAGWRVNQSGIQGANIWGKLKTVVQVLAIGLLIKEWPGGLICFWLAVFLTLGSGLTYVMPQTEAVDKSDLDP